MGIFILKVFRFIYMYDQFACIVYKYMYHVWAWCSWRGKEGIKTGVTVVGQHVGAVNQTQILCNNSKCSKQLSQISL